MRPGRRDRRPTGRRRWSHDLFEPGAASIEPAPDQRRPFGALELVSLITIMVALVIVIVASKDEDHSRYAPRPSLATQVEQDAR